MRELTKTHILIFDLNISSESVRERFKQGKAYSQRWQDPFHSEDGIALKLAQEKVMNLLSIALVIGQLRDLGEYK